MAVQIGEVAPDFDVETTEGRIRFHDWIGDSWAVLFSHPKDFTPVCTTELGYMAKMKPEFDKRNTKIIGLSVDPVSDHVKWSADIKETQGHAPNFPMIGDKWAILFSHPKDFTPVCTTELGETARLKPEFDKRNVKVIGLSVDPVENHKRWAQDIQETQGAAPNYPMIGDTDLKVAKLYGMLPAALEGTCDGRTAADNQTVRNVYVIGPDKKVKLMIAYPMTTGRNFDEVLRVIDSLQLTAKHKVATPANWKPGEDVIIAGSVSDDEAKEIFGEWDSPKPYIRVVPQPGR